MKNQLQLSFITPTAYIKDYQSQGDFILALSHLLDQDKENEYERAIKKTNLPIILDNGLFENHFPEGIDFLINKAQKINAHTFFAPDILYNKIETQKALEYTTYILKKLNLFNKIKIAVVVQADNADDYIQQYKDFCQNPAVDLIGLSILSIPRCFGKQGSSKREPYIHNDNEIVESRIECLKELNKLNVQKKSHLLGLGNSYRDVLFAKENCPWIYSHDSSSAFWNAMQNKKILNNGDIEGGKTKVSVDFNFKNATEKKLKLAQYNINQVKKLIK